jgi:hypothetical protein
MERINSDVNRFIDIRFLEAGDCCNLLARTWIENIKGLTVCGFNPAATNKRFVQSRGIWLQPELSYLFAQLKTSTSGISYRWTADMPQKKGETAAD